MDWFDLLEVQAAFKSLLQHHSPKASILRYLAFYYNLLDIETYALTLT